MRKSNPEYVRVYQSIVDDDKFVTVFDDDHHLATWLRLLMVADAMWPASAVLPQGTRKASVSALEQAGLIDVTGSRYRIRGLDSEREQRAERGRKGGEASRDARTNVERSLDDRATTVPPTLDDRATSPSPSPSPSTSPSQAEGASDDIVDDYYRLTNRFPSPAVTEWLERLAAEFTYDAASRKLAAEFTADPSAKTLLGRVENELKSAKHNAAKDAALREKQRLEAFAKDRSITPEQAAENRRRIAEIQKEWFGGKEAA